MQIAKSLKSETKAERDTTSKCNNRGAVQEDLFLEGK